jgi:hypothetical protein
MRDVMTYIDMICRIAPWPLPDPEAMDFAHSPPVVRGGAALTYARMTAQQAAAWQARGAVCVLAQAPHMGEGTADVVYAALFADVGATEAYDEVHPRTPWIDEDGAEHLPPERIGQIG